MRQLTDLLNDDWGSPKKGTYPAPCQGIENLSYDYSEKSGIDSGPEPRFMVLVHFLITHISVKMQLTIVSHYQVIIANQLLLLLVAFYNSTSTLSTMFALLVQLTSKELFSNAWQFLSKIN